MQYKSHIVDFIKYKNGEDGNTPYIHIKYSNDGGVTFTENNGETPGEYMGVYADFTEADSLDLSKYKWSKIKGEQGLQGLKGDPGDKGDTTYFHVKYSPVANPTASQMSETPNAYIGSYVDTIQADSNDPSRYSWYKMKGEDGQSIKGEDGKTYYWHIRYSNDGGKTFTANSGETPGDYLGQCVNNTEADPTTVSSYTWTKIKGEAGTGIDILGSYESESALKSAHPTGKAGEAYLVQGDLYVWNGTAWQNVGNIQGPKGDPGTQGPVGPDGRTSYVHIKYSDDGTTFTSNNGETLGEWIGIYTDYTEEDSTTFSDYKWKKISGNLDSQLETIKSTLTNHGNRIEAKVEKTDFTGTKIVSLINLDETTATIKAKNISLEGIVTANEHFKILNDGTIYAKGGTLGGWTLNSSYIYALKDNKYTQLKSGGNVALVLGAPQLDTTTGAAARFFHDGRVNLGYNGGNTGEPSDYNFYVKEDGSLRIEGEITAASGSIGDFSINHGALLSGDAYYDEDGKTFECNGTGSWLFKDLLSFFEKDSEYIYGSHLSAKDLNFWNSESETSTLITFEGIELYTESDSIESRIVFGRGEDYEIGIISPEGIYGNGNLLINFATGKIVATGVVCSGAKSSNTDGAKGCLLGGTGTIYLQGSSSSTVPRVCFYKGGSTSLDAQINLDSDSYMNFKDASRYVFDKQIYINTSAVSTSDRNKKKDFAGFDERYEKLFFELKPQIYKFKDGTSDRFHSGFISQEVEEAMFTNGLKSTDFAGYCKEIQRKVVVNTDEEYRTEEVHDENGNPVYDYMLRYEEFIALNTYMLQKAYREIELLKDEVKQLKGEVA